MKKIILPILIITGFAAVGIYGKVLSDRCDELREKQAKQEMALLKQSEILAINTAMLHTLVTSLSPEHKTTVTGKEGLKMDTMP